MQSNETNKYCHYIHIRDLSEKNICLANYDSIIWDLDGTLYSIAALKLKIFKTLYRFSVFKNIYNFFQTEKLIQKERESHGFGLDLYRDNFYTMQEFINSYLNKSLVRPEAIQLAKVASNHKLNQLVVSEYPIGNKLELLEVVEYFQGAFSCSEDMGSWKPSEKTAHFVLSKLGNAQRILVFGDREDTDGEMAKNIHNLINISR